MTGLRLFARRKGRMTGHPCVLVVQWTSHWPEEPVNNCFPAFARESPPEHAAACVTIHDTATYLQLTLGFSRSPFFLDAQAHFPDLLQDQVQPARLRCESVEYCAVLWNIEISWDDRSVSGRNGALSFSSGSESVHARSEDAVGDTG
jgi:hypothetical protein